MDFKVWLLKPDCFTFDIMHTIQVYVSQSWSTVIWFFLQEKIAKHYGMLREGKDLSAEIQRLKEFRNPR